MEDQKKDDFLVLSDVPAYVNREKKYRRPSKPDVDTVEIDIDSVQSEDSKTSRFAPEPVASYDRYSTLSYTRKGADFSRKKPFCKRPEGKLIEERNIGGLGIFIVKKTMDEVTYEYKDGQNILTIKKSL